MKQYLKMLVCIGSVLILLPVFMLRINNIPMGRIEAAGGNEQIELSELGQQEDVMDEKALIGILAKEIPYTYETEAVKAQAVIERTYMARRILGIQNKGAIIGYTEEEMKRLWGEKFDRIYSIYDQAVRETKGKLILYEGQPIEAIYHKASSGKTRSASAVYHVEVPYLQGVESSKDIVSNQISYTKTEIAKRLKARYSNIVISTEELENELQIVQKDDAGYVQLMQIGNITIQGEEFASILELPSCAFKIYNMGEKLIFDVRGIGNGVGLSLNGANELAKQGQNYNEIINHYYTNVTIGNYEFQK